MARPNNRIPAWACRGGLLAVLIFTTLPAFAQDDPFADRHKAPANGKVGLPVGPKGEDDDPFSLANQAQPVKPDGNPPVDPKRPKLNRTEQTIRERIEFTARVEPKTVRPGQTFKLIITGKPRAGFHTYSRTRRTPQQADAQLSYVEFDKNGELRPLLDQVDESPPADFVKEESGEELYELGHEFTWTQDVLVMPETTPGRHALTIRIKLQACDKNTCVGPGYYTGLQAEVNVQGPPVSLTDELRNRLAARATVPRVVDEGGLWGFVVISMGAAVLMLLTPCVFPMIPITVSFFLKQSEKEHHNALLSAGVYCLTIIVVLTLAVFLLGSLVTDLANDPWLNLGLGAVLVFFAFSLFGMYEIELPSFLARFTSAREGQGGIPGAFFMALTFTITSFTCTGPFLGPLLAGAGTLQPSREKLILGALAYSVVFAAPFFVLALFPRLLKSLPKSGGWLNAIKVVMGFLELAAALKFIANTDLALNPGDPMFFTYETVLCAWIALSLACGMYLFGVFRLPHDSPVEHIGVVRMLFASLFVGLSVYMVPALWRVTPQGVVGKGLVAFLPLDTRLDTEWTRDLDEAWAEALETGKPLFIDFTGQNCTNCRYNEKNVFTKQAVREELKNYVRLQLYTDIVPEEGLSAGEAADQAARNKRIQDGTFSDITNPFYAILWPAKGQKPYATDKDGTLKLNASVVGTRSGLIPANKVKQFVTFLRNGRNKDLAGRVAADANQ
jgi:cytochrome c biogenesis protein CcdA